MQMDNKGWNGQKASFTEATSNSEYQHVSLCSFSISFPFSLLLPIFPSILQVVLVTEMARRLISVTGQWASDCQFNRLCILVGSLRIEAHSLWLTGLHSEALRGVPLTTTAFLCKKVVFHKGLTQSHTHTHSYTHTHAHNSVHSDMTMKNEIRWWWCDKINIEHLGMFHITTVDKIR